MTTRQRTSQQVSIPISREKLHADLVVPSGATGIVLFAHGSGSSRFSTRNRYVAEVLHDGGLATLLIDLLTPSEERIDLTTGRLRFNIELLTERVVSAIDWLDKQSEMRQPGIGLFGASTGAAAALAAAAERSEAVAAVVSRGGRPDLAEEALPGVLAPTLLIVGGYDTEVIRLNETAFKQLRCTKEMKVVPRASHLFEEPGALEAVAGLARDWFVRYLGSVDASTLNN